MDEHLGYGPLFTDVWKANMTILPQLVAVLKSKTHIWCRFKDSLKLRKPLNVANVPVVVFDQKQKC